MMDGGRFDAAFPSAFQPWPLAQGGAGGNAAGTLGLIEQAVGMLEG